MAAAEFDTFRLVGGTALSLQIGHRKSVDIDLFSDADYGTIDFSLIDRYLANQFPYVDHHAGVLPGMGKSYFIGVSKQNAVKLDVFHTDDFIQAVRKEDHIRMATVEEIIAMKLDVVQRGGRKKDFWDLHELLDTFSLDHMLKLHAQRYPFSHHRETLLANFSDFTQADDDFDPICLKGKYWEFVKEDIIKVMDDYRNSL